MTTKKKSIFGYFNNNWTVTLLSTMIGVYAGIYLSNYFERKALIRAKEKAFNEVITEINDNHQLLESYHEIISSKYDPIDYIFSYMTDDKKLVIPEDSLETFIMKADTLFKYENSVPVKGGLELNGELNLHITSDLVARDLSNIVWESYKQTNYISLTNFRCLTDLETIYKLQREVNELNGEWMDQFFQGQFYGDRDMRKSFLQSWHQLIFTQRLLLLYYNQKDKAILNCQS